LCTGKAIICPDSWHTTDYAHSVEQSTSPLDIVNSNTYTVPPAKLSVMGLVIQSIAACPGPIQNNEKGVLPQELQVS